MNAVENGRTYEIIKRQTHNGRFGASGAVARLKICAYFEVLRPSERQFKPRSRAIWGQCVPHREMQGIKN